MPPGTGRRHVLRIGHELDRTAAAPAWRAPPTCRDARRGRAARAAPSLIFVVSDFIGTGDWERPLLRLTHRHEVVALRVVDPIDDELPDAGLIVVEDAETGEQLLVDSSDPLFRARFRAEASTSEMRR